MSENSSIEWTDHTRNFWSGCTKVSAGCKNCYAEALAKRNIKTFGKWGAGKPREWHGEGARKDLLKWNRKAESAGTRFRVFPNSMSDWLDEEVPIEWLAFMLQTIRITPFLDYQLLTKRPGKWRSAIETICDEIYSSYDDDDVLEIAWLTSWLEGGAPENVWVGATVEDQAQAAGRIPELLEIPAKVRFLSCEPLLEAVDLVNLDGFNILCDSGIDWVICGGESGSGCRPFEADWARDLRDQCEMGTVAFFMKQMGGVKKPFPEIPVDLMVREFPKGGGL